MKRNDGPSAVTDRPLHDRRVFRANPIEPKPNSSSMTDTSRMKRNARDSPESPFENGISKNPSSTSRLTNGTSFIPSVPSVNGAYSSHRLDFDDGPVFPGRGPESPSRRSDGIGLDTDQLEGFMVEDLQNADLAARARSAGGDNSSLTGSGGRYDRGSGAAGISEPENWESIIISKIPTVNPPCSSASPAARAKLSSTARCMANSSGAAPFTRGNGTSPSALSQARSVAGMRSAASGGSDGDGGGGGGGGGGGDGGGGIGVVAATGIAAGRAEQPKAWGVQSFQLVAFVEEAEQLCVHSADELCRLLACGPDAAIKVVSIFGNTGDGKSYTLNHTFFGGDPVFETSDRQDSCTAGAWAAHDPARKAVVIDTEGMLAVSHNENARLRLLLKVLALSDVVVYCTKAERLHQDMFHFLEDASAAYCKYFNEELRSAAQRTGARFTSSVGPALVIFHETRNTVPLDADSLQPLILRFSPAGASGLAVGGVNVGMAAAAAGAASGPCFPVAYSDVKYVGSRSSGPTDFGPLRDAVVRSLDATSVRLHRPPRVVYEQLQALSRKFSGDIAAPVWGAFPDAFFRCPVRCLSCGAQCLETVCHDPSVPHRPSQLLCTYSTRYENVEHVCQACIRRGRRNVVIKTESKTLGVVWGASYRCRDCGVVYSAGPLSAEKERQEKLRPEYHHVWSEPPPSFPTGGYTARLCIEQVSKVAAMCSSVGEQPAALASSAMKQVNALTMPSYWVPDNYITACRACARSLGEVHSLSHGSSGGGGGGGGGGTGSARKHHCRGCGEGFCGPCSRWRAAVPARGWLRPVRVCEACHRRLSAPPPPLAGAGGGEEVPVSPGSSACTSPGGGGGSGAWSRSPALGPEPRGRSASGGSAGARAAAAAVVGEDEEDLLLGEEEEEGFCLLDSVAVARLPEDPSAQRPTPAAERCAAAAAAVSAEVVKAAPILPRQGVETLVGVVQLVHSGVAGCSQAVTRLAAPDYWEPDEKVTQCAVCSVSFLPPPVEPPADPPVAGSGAGAAAAGAAAPAGVLSSSPSVAGDGAPAAAAAGDLAAASTGSEPPPWKHHCRRCGRGVCAACSRSRRRVPSRRWDDVVRVCDPCAEDPDPL